MWKFFPRSEVIVNQVHNNYIVMTLLQWNWHTRMQSWHPHYVLYIFSHCVVCFLEFVLLHAVVFCGRISVANRTLPSSPAWPSPHPVGGGVISGFDIMLWIQGLELGNRKCGYFPCTLSLLTLKDWEVGHKNDRYKRNSTKRMRMYKGNECLMLECFTLNNKPEELVLVLETER